MKLTIEEILTNNAIALIVIAFDDTLKTMKIKDRQRWHDLLFMNLKKNVHEHNKHLSIK